MIQPVRVVIWLVEGSWQGCVDAAVDIIPAGARVGLLHVTPSDVSEVAEAATGGLLGRAFPRRAPAHHFGDLTKEAAAALLSSAAARLGRQDVDLLSRQGRVEREVVLAVSEDIDLLVAARDGDRSHLGPRSLGPTTRFVVDHASCAVLLVWPDQPPGIESIPPPPRSPVPG
jgi:nucleotide-binding universal stress UspA family protein